MVGVVGVAEVVVVTVVGVGEVVGVTKGGVVVLVPQHTTVVGVVVVPFGFVRLVDVVEEDVVDGDEMTPKSMSRRCSPSSRWTMYVITVAPSSWASPCPKTTRRERTTAMTANVVSAFTPPLYASASARSADSP